MINAKEARSALKQCASAAKTAAPGPALVGAFFPLAGTMLVALTGGTAPPAMATILGMIGAACLARAIGGVACVHPTPVVPAVRSREPDRARDAPDSDEKAAIVIWAQAVVHGIANDLAKAAIAVEGLERGVLHGQGRATELPTPDDLTAGADALDSIVRRADCVIGGRGPEPNTASRTDIAALLSQRAARLGSVCQLDLQPGHVFLVAAEQCWIECPLRDILENAADAVRATGGRVFVSARQQGNRVVVTVDDEGPGLVGLTTADLFLPHRTTKANGHGIGLFVSKLIVESCYGGHLGYEARDPCGARFRIELPLAGA